MPAVIDSLRQEHANMAKLLSLLDRQFEIFNSGGAPDYDLIVRAVEYLSDWSGQWHHPKEDLVLDKLRQRDPAAAEPVGDLEADHDVLAGLTARFLAVIREVLAGEELPRDQVSRVAGQFLNSERRHMKGEDTVFLPAAERALTAEDWADIALQIGDPGDPLFGRTVEERFRPATTRIVGARPGRMISAAGL